MCARCVCRAFNLGDEKVTNFSEYLNEQMKDYDFKKEYDALEEEFTSKQAIIDALKARGLAQPEITE